MPTVHEFILRMLPDGANRSEDATNKTWETFPHWPPDLFAITASLVERCGCYSHPHYTGGRWEADLYIPSFYENDYVIKIQFTAKMWARLSLKLPLTDEIPNLITGPAAITELQKRWENIYNCLDDIEPCHAGKQPPSWCDDAMWLLAVADEASAGIGFFQTSEYDLLLRLSINDLGAMPGVGNNLIVVASVSGVLRFRIFDSDSKMVVDTDAENFTDKVQQIAELKKRLESLSISSNPIDIERYRIIADVISITGINSKKFDNPFVDFWMRQYIIWDITLFLKGKLGKSIVGNEEAVLRENLVSLFGEGDHCLDLLNNHVDLYSHLVKNRGLSQLTTSLCAMVPRSEACVQPKTRSSAVGCTLRSLSHHLALLPPVSQVETRWRVSNRYPTKSKEVAGPQALNLLLVPFPYNIQGTCFKGDQACVGSHRGDWNDEGVNRSRFFSLDQKWLFDANNPLRPVDANEISAFLSMLISIAEREVEKVHGLILPELALTVELAKNVAQKLSKDHALEIFISGVFASARPGRGPKNSVYTSIMKGNGVAGDEELAWANGSWMQAKHHRWKLEKHQIRRYHLGGRLDPHIDWWEHIDISPRQCIFGTLWHEACVTALICEDLARIDPVQTAIRSIGPNLVVALLMDGPQIESRWSGRYATVLADDPGSAVLTLTSLGLINRSAEPGKPSSGQIGLWKDAGGEKATELIIPQGHHGLLLNLSYKRDITYTMDGRPDVTKTVSLSRSGYHPIKHPCAPMWLA